jgi:hypothetical protein
MTKKANELAIRNCASLAETAWTKLEAAAQEAMKPNGATPALQLVADTSGITALIKDTHGTRVMIQGGKISVDVEAIVTEVE